MEIQTREDRVLGLLLGTAVGDALGLPFEGMSADSTRRAFRLRSPLYVGWGRAAVSDDTEQAALLAQALGTNQFLASKEGGSADQQATIVRAFRRSLIAWFLRLPFGIGFGTLRACARLCVGLRGSSSAGNGAMMRAPILGTLPQKLRREVGREVAELTHLDVRAVEAALFAADVAAACLSHEGRSDGEVRSRIVVDAATRITSADIKAAVASGLAAARLSEALRSRANLPNTGFAPHSVALCVASFVRDGTTCLSAISSCIRAGGDTDTHAAIVGAWSGALCGAQSIDSRYIALLQRGPFGVLHLKRLAASIVHQTQPPDWSPLRALLRNLSLYPLVLMHGVVRVVRW